MILTNIVSANRKIVQILLRNKHFLYQLYIDLIINRDVQINDDTSILILYPNDDPN